MKADRTIAEKVMMKMQGCIGTVALEFGCEMMMAMGGMN